MSLNHATGTMDDQRGCYLCQEHHSKCRKQSNEIRATAYKALESPMKLDEGSGAYYVELIQGCPASFHPAWTSPAIYANSWMRR